MKSKIKRTKDEKKMIENISFNLKNIIENYDGEKTYRALGKKTGFTGAYIHGVIHGNILPSIVALKKLSDSFGVSITEIINER